MPRTGLIFLAILALASPVVSGKTSLLAPRTWERGEDGKWRQVDDLHATGAPATSDETVANPALDEVEQLLARRRHAAAKPRIIRWIKRNTAAPDRDRGLFLLSEMYNQSGDKVRAFYHLDELMDYYPESRLFYPALEKQFAIADSFLRGHRRRFLGLPFLSTEDEGVEILFRIQERAPGSPIAERALLRTADHYYDTSQFDLASDAYEAYARSYPRSPEVPRVRLRQAFSSLAQFRGLRFDVTPVIDARTQLEDIRAEYPEMAERENVADVLDRIDGILAARVAMTADFYRRTGEPQAVVYNLRYLLENYPEAPEAAKARRDLERMPSSAMELPAPQGGTGTDVEQQLGTPGVGAAPPAPVTPPSDAPDDRTVSPAAPPVDQSPASEAP